MFHFEFTDINESFISYACFLNVKEVCIISSMKKEERKHNPHGNDDPRDRILKIGY